MNRLDNEKRAQVISCLIEGCSIRSTVRMTGVAKKTVMRVLVEVGEVCADYQDHVFRNLRCKRLQLDEMWAWIYCKEKNRTEEIARTHPDSGDVWLWIAADADTKLVPSWMLGQRDTATATAFVSDLASRLSNRVQITTDGHRPYLEAVENAFGMEVDYSILQKIYGSVLENETRYSPAKCIGIDVRHVSGNPDPKHISTSYIERQNWTVRTKMRRYTRLSNGFSRKLGNHAAATALNYFAYNFIQIHSTLRTSPAMAAGVTNRLWDAKDLVTLWESFEYEQKKVA
ncbi:MAG: IS1 family transposase [Acidobacteria bacterium]|nr:MAG: IS1 family transposase [Acidobacteriota bacterium]